jgi:hypothetical protein
MTSKVKLSKLADKKIKLLKAKLLKVMMAGTLHNVRTKEILSHITYLPIWRIDDVGDAVQANTENLETAGTDTVSELMKTTHLPNQGIHGDGVEAQLALILSLRS